MKYAIIGYPVEHSLSPLMHEAGFKAIGIDAEYHRIPVLLSELEDRIKLLKCKGYAGWNVTYPLKEEIISLLNTLTPPANDIGAVNAVKVVDGSLQGHNTDGEGFLESLKARNYDLKNKKVVILGAGGAAKGIAITLASKKTEILILNRSLNKAKNLAQHITNLGGKAYWGMMSNGDWLTEVDLLIQTTPVGMNNEKYFFDLRGIKKNALVIDIIYKPFITPFLFEAAKQGCQIMNGLDMLLYQGILTWKYWFNMEAPVSVMRSVLPIK